MTSPAMTRFSAKAFADMPDAGRYDLICGELVERQMSARSSQVGRRMNYRVDAAIERDGLPFISTGPDGGFQCFADVLPEDPGRVLFPDGAATST